MNETYMMTSREVENLGKGVRLVHLYPQSLLIKKVLEGIRTYIILGVMLIIICLIAAVVISLKSTGFLNEFIHAMESVRNRNYDIRIKEYKNAEINSLGRAFNEMMDELRELIRNKYESQILLNEMEIRFLQHQMNPHFLFNVLLTIQIKAKRSGNETIYKEILNSTFLDHKVVVAEGESGMLIFVIEYKGSEENAAWFQRRLEKVVSIAKIFQNIRLRIGAGKVVKSAEWGRVGKKQAIRNLSDIYTDNSPVNVKENYTEYIQYWKDENDVESYMRRLYVALRSGMEENKKLCAEEFEEYLKQETRPIEQCRSDTHAIILYLVRKVKSKEKMEKILVPEKALDAVYRSKSKAALAEVMRETCEAISTILEEEQKEGSSLSRKVNSIIERDYRGKISLKDIGKELFVNSSYLSRVYKKETGYTVTDAINSYRIEKAKEILETGEYRVCEVGEMVGIEDPAYFTHVFLKYEGKSPSDFMNR